MTEIPSDVVVPAVVYTKPTLTYMDKAIGAMSDKELVEASFKLVKMKEELELKRKDPRFIKKMQGQPAPGINPHFENVLREVDAEIENRGIAK